MTWSLEEEQAETVRLVAAASALLKAANGPIPTTRSARMLLLRQLMRRPDAAAYRAARERFILETRGLCQATARRFHDRGVEHQELVAAGDRSLLDAIDYWEPRPEIRFSAYALSWIRSGMLQRLQAERRLSRIRGAVAEASLSMESTYEIDLDTIGKMGRLASRLPTLGFRTRQILAARYGRGESHAEVGERLQLTERSILRIHQRALRRLRLAVDSRRTVGRDL
jgi:RNA polymerase sigma factor (sigma-70 family)